MLYLVSWTIPMENRDAAIERFLKNGALPHAAVKLLGRWHAVGHMLGFGLAEAESPIEIQRWMMQWNDLLDMQVHPALTDQDLAPLMMELMQQKQAALNR
ncbi:DUF3303 domain-containing protein [Pseudomonas sp. PDM18]|uniref:DUF3303 domain-containing protein n=1 Tax=unclassified Pseudomonas TaxID=196821 RepID=UPI00178444FE|nr:DUF3303 family protein [Pseudomonas sp. PDM18]MBD9675783.1 DUF3303 domain-containing protein [Pseudomonas sp. PDM18]